MEIFFFKNYAENKAGKLVPDLFLFLKNAWSEVKASGLQLGFNIFRYLGYNKNKLYKTLDYWSRDMLKFNFPENSLELVSLPHFMYDFSRKMFLMLYSINWPKFNVWLPILLEILGDKCIATNQAVMSWKIEINLIFLIKPFCYKTKKSRQKLKYLENKKSFWGELKSFIHRFWRAFNCQKLTQTCERAYKRLFLTFFLVK